MKSFKAQYPNVAATLGFTEVEQSAEGTYLQDEQLKSLEAALAASKDFKSQAQAAQEKAEALQAQLQESNSKVSAHEATITDLQTKLSQRPGVAPSGNSANADIIEVGIKARFKGLTTNLKQHRTQN